MSRRCVGSSHTSTRTWYRELLGVTDIPQKRTGKASSGAQLRRELCHLRPLQARGTPVRQHQGMPYLPSTLLQISPQYPTSRCSVSYLTSSRTERRVRHLRRGALFRLVVEDVHAARLRRLDVALGAVRGGRNELAALVPELQGVLVGQSILALTFSRLATRNNAVHPRPRALQRTRDCRRLHHPEAAPPSPFRLLRVARWSTTQCSGLPETCSIWHCSFIIGIFIYPFFHIRIHSYSHIHTFTHPLIHLKIFDVKSSVDELVNK